MNKYLIPLIIFACFAGLYVGYSLVNHSNYLYQPVWDIKQYLDISERGYDAHPCGSYDYPPGKICGNVGWYPMWPILIGVVRSIIGLPAAATLTGLAFFLSLIAFFVLYQLVEERYGRNAAIVSLLALAFNPTSFYLLTGFPYAFFTFLFAMYLKLLYGSEGRAREIGLFFCALAISLTYPTGILIAVVPVLWYLLFREGESRQRRDLLYWLGLVKYVVPFIIGPLILWSYFHFKFGDFFLQLHFQEKYHRSWAIPFVTMFKSLISHPLFSAENAVILWYGVGLLLCIPYKLKTELWVLAVVLFLFSPATGSTMSIYRHYLIIIPAYMIIGTSSRPLWLKLALIVTGIMLAVMILFPLFITNRLI